MPIGTFLHKSLDCPKVISYYTQAQKFPNMPENAFGTSNYASKCLEISENALMPKYFSWCLRMWNYAKSAFLGINYASLATLIVECTSHSTLVLYGRGDVSIPYSKGNCRDWRNAVNAHPPVYYKWCACRYDYNRLSRTRCCCGITYWLQEIFRPPRDNSVIICMQYIKL